MQRKHTNRLINETSPYLLQHAHNPVDWYPWCEEAFERAKAENKPVLVSIGYSACHWCHVMERESFEDEETAKIMNENFINVKVDMEERPDVDQVYMTFVQATTGSGGWPLNVFVTPDKKPFFGGTYFPPEDRYNLPSFRKVLLAVAQAWKNNREEILRSSEQIIQQIKEATRLESTTDHIKAEISEIAFEKLSKSFDEKNGGFGGAPKFPPSMTLEFLLRYHRRTKNQKALQMVVKTCQKMAMGGIYDQIGGGFHRYSVDSIWLVPHFEKMLYDNAQLTRIYLHLYQITKDDFFKKIATETLEYIEREMLHPEGGFFSTQDADSEGEEGKFFLWTFDEIELLLGEENAKIFCFYYGVTEDGNFEGKNILHIKYTPEEAAEILKIPVEKLNETVEQGRKILFSEREKRVKPNRDEKIITAWNGLMMATFAEAAAILSKERYLEIAQRNADFLISNLIKDDQLLRTWKDGKAKLNAYIEDYANLAEGLIELFQINSELKYLKMAEFLAEKMIEDFWDRTEGGFFFTSHDHEQIAFRQKDFQDNATPSGNSVAAELFLKLSKFTGKSEYENYSVSIFKKVATQIIRYPNAFGRMLSAIEFYLAPKKEIIIIGSEGNPLQKYLWSVYLPEKIAICIEAPTDELISSLPILEEKKQIEGKPTAFVCQNFVCEKPVTELEEFRRQIE
ncbi:MAG: thioredoxin domain-containing protein [Pyrinomonadaceae bacterium]|nr:thioredoxin domain-containing protein [Pyrinomonadaceae bacterium]MCX7640923.1 thioredoxin domain-containing protein [Pyrinomonadaceae bacterium]MDW8304705.1 thioredoxin domain-containing protein [Acidobacteriota bacterium]